MKKTFSELVKTRQNLVLIAEKSQKPVGALIATYYLDLDWEAQAAKLQAIIVHTNHRHKSIGTRLFQQFLKVTESRGCKAITLRVNRKNRPAQAFYKKLRFQEAETREYTLELPETVRPPQTQSIKSPT